MAYLMLIVIGFLPVLTLLTGKTVRRRREKSRPAFRALNGGGVLSDGSYPIRTHGDAERALLLAMEGHGNAQAARVLIRRIAEENRWRDILHRLDATPERREPRDMTRPYPKRVVTGPDDERLTTCPVCGMEDPLFLDGGPAQASFFGWPAHATCVEWLGEWKPPASAALSDKAIAELQRELDRVKRDGWSVHLPPARPSVLTPEWGMARAAEAVGAQVDAMKAGMITMDELRERIVGAFGIPEMMITATSASSGTVTCNCGMCFSGNAVDVDRSMEAHRTCGQHEQRMEYLLKRLG